MSCRTRVVILPLAILLSVSLVGLACDGLGGDTPTKTDPGASLDVPTDTGWVTPDPGHELSPDVPPYHEVYDPPDPGFDVPPDTFVPECTPEMVYFDCDDGDTCTKETCEGGLCVHTPIEDCCLADADCDDGVACTIDECNTIMHQCLHTFEDNYCCLSAADCDDQDECTHDVCAANRCVHPRSQLPSCGCANTVECDDDNPCTQQECLSANDQCLYTSTGDAGCCTTDADCDDSDATTLDACQQHRCWHKPLGCEEDLDCANPDPCSSGACVEGSCVFTPAAHQCCSAGAECDDGIATTLDVCIETECVHALDGTVTSCTDAAGCPASTTCLDSTCASLAGHCSAAIFDGGACCTDPVQCPPAADYCHAPSCEAFACGFAELTGSQPFWEETFALDLTEWTIVDDGKGPHWQLADAQAISLPWSLYYGKLPEMNYYVEGSPTAGTATSPLITPPAGAASLTLSFWVSTSIEAIGSVDQLKAFVVVDGTPTEVWDKLDGGGLPPGWNHIEVDITSQATGPLQVAFDFDSIDDEENEFEGVYIDDVGVLAPCP